MSNSFYIPIQSMNLAHYLGSGIIVPSIYIENKNLDIQNRFENYLLLSSSKFTKDTNCAIEIVLNNDEEAPKKISEHFYLFDMPLPISRIKNIYFTNEEQKVNTNFNIATGSAFIPEGLLKVSQEESIETKELDTIEFQPSKKNWSEYLKKYDQVLGGFSTMKISKENFQNYPTHYFSALGNINTLFSNILTQQNINIENSFQFAFTDEGRFKSFHNTIYSEIDYNEVQRYAENDKVKLEVKNGLVQIDKIAENTQTYLVAILESYGKGKRKQVDSFISDLISIKFVEKKKEGLSLIFGLNKGYKAFRNKYKTANFEVDIKFHLDSKLDYYIIESIYQNVFNSLNNILSFKYIDSLFVEVKEEENKNPNYVTYQMIDKTIIWKPIELTLVEKVLRKISDIISKWFPFSIKKNEIELLFKSEIEHFKNEVETDVSNKYKAELEQNKALVEQLNNAILERDNKIQQLENRIQNVQTINQSEIEKNVDKPIEIKSYEAAQSNKENLISENSGSLFSNDNELISDELSRVQLEKLSMTALKKKAKELKIPRYSTYKINTELINEILKLNK
ncbi:hypothetical protein [Empedobacter brevis]|uniref:hypothetical protein n=1 Tax=Empedobacter brevis TaxID=247 RepID=UPI0028AE114E|nr:hypothetical protein [Empedobacter brevis]